LKPLYCKA